MQFLRSNTAVIVTVGPFYDKTDGVTIETGLTITNERLTLTADTDEGSAPTLILDNITGATAATANDLNYITNGDSGHMQLELAAANVNRVGRMWLSITDAANHVPVFHEYFVLPTAIYDWLTGVIVPLPANVTTIAGSAVSTSTAQLGVNTVNAGGTAWGSGAITAASIATDAIGALELADGAITAATFAAGAIDATAIADGAIDAATFAAGAITATAIADAAIDAATFAAGAITAAAIADAAIDAATFAANAITSTVIANDAITDAKVASDVTIASVTGAVGSVTGAVGSIATGGIAAASFAAGAIDAAAIAANAIGASEIADGAIDAGALAADAVDEILDEAIGDSTVTMRQALKILVSALAGKLSGAATTTVVIRNVADDADRITATVDADGNRSAVTLSL